MDPMTMLAVAQAGLGAVSTVWNYFAGQSQIANERAKASATKSALDVSRSNQLEGLANQHQLGMNQVSSAVSQQAGTMAEHGADGPMMGLAAGATEQTGMQQLDTQYTQAVNNVDDNYRNMMRYYGVDQVNEQADAAEAQNGMNAITGMIGVGLSAAGTLLKGWKPTQGSPALPQVSPSSPLMPQAPKVAPAFVAPSNPFLAPSGLNAYDPTMARFSPQTYLPR